MLKVKHHYSPLTELWQGIDTQHMRPSREACCQDTIRFSSTGPCDIPGLVFPK